jgi:hypothetical protein
MLRISIWTDIRPAGYPANTKAKVFFVLDFSCKKNTIDNWRHDLFDAAPGNDILKVRSVDICKNLHPVLFDIVCDYENFYTRFSGAGRNFETSYIFENGVFTTSENTGTTININFFGRATYNVSKINIRNLKYGDCFIGPRFKSFAELLVDIPGLTFNCWWRLRNALLRLKSTQINSDSNCKILDIAEFSNSLKKGSKKIRKFFDLAREKNCSLEATTTFKTFISLVGIAPSRREFLSDWTSTWRYNPLTNDLKKFIFNCRYNLLPLNNRLNAYLPNIDPRCTGN